MPPAVDSAVLDHLWLSHVAGRTDPGEFPQLDVEAGQALQVALIERYAANGRTVGGWKVGLTSGAARDSFGKGVRPFGFVLADRIFASNAVLSLAAIGSCGVENELCFTMGERLGKDATAETARLAVATVAPAFEVNQLRLRGRATPGLAVADNLSQWGIVIGEAQPLPDAFDYEALTIVLSRDGMPVETTHAHGHIDDHFQSIAKLSNRLATFGLALEKGHRVITGSYTRQSVPSPSRWTGAFGKELGSVHLSISS